MAQSVPEKPPALILLNETRNGRIGYYLCPADVPRSILLKLAEAEKKFHPRYLAIHIKFASEQDDINVVKFLEENTDIEITSTTKLRYQKSRVGGLLFRHATATSGCATVKDLFGQKIEKDFDHSAPFSEKNLYLKRELQYGENFDMLYERPENVDEEVIDVVEDMMDVVAASIEEVASVSSNSNGHEPDERIRATQLRHGRTFLMERLYEMTKMESILDTLKEGHNEIPGITTPFYYIGVAFTTSSIHLEDFFIPSLNYLFKGSAAKYWLFINGLDMIKLNELLGKETFECTYGIFHKYNVVTTELLDEMGIDYDVVVQNECQMIITFPQGAHMVVNGGRNVAIAKNWIYKNALSEIRSIPRCTCPLDEGFRWLWDYIYGTEIGMKMGYDLNVAPLALRSRFRLIARQFADCRRWHGLPTASGSSISNVANIVEQIPSSHPETSILEADNRAIVPRGSSVTTDVTQASSAASTSSNSVQRPSRVSSLILRVSESRSGSSSSTASPDVTGNIQNDTMSTFHESILNTPRPSSLPQSRQTSYGPDSAEDEHAETLSKEVSQHSLPAAIVENVQVESIPDVNASTPYQFIPSQSLPDTDSMNGTCSSVDYIDAPTTSHTVQILSSSPTSVIPPIQQHRRPSRILGDSNDKFATSRNRRPDIAPPTSQPSPSSFTPRRAGNRLLSFDQRGNRLPSETSANAKPRKVITIVASEQDFVEYEDTVKAASAKKNQRHPDKRTQRPPRPYDKKKHALRKNKHDRVKNLIEKEAQLESETAEKSRRALELSIEKTRDTIFSHDLKHMFLMVCDEFPQEALHFQYDHGYSPFDVLKHFVDPMSDADKSRVLRILKAELAKEREYDRKKGLDLADRLEEAVNEWEIFLNIGPLERIPAKDPPEFVVAEWPDAE